MLRKGIILQLSEENIILIFANYKKLNLKKLTGKIQNIFFSDIKQIDAFIHCAGINAKESKLNKEKAFKFNSITSGKIARLCREK